MKRRGINKQQPFHHRDDLTTFVYPGRDGWRWHTEADNHRLVAESGEAFEAKDYAVTSAKRYAPPSRIVVREEREVE